MAVRAFRGATCLTEDTVEQMREAVGELLQKMLVANDLHADDLISLFLTSTPDLTCEFPAAAVRAAGLTDVPLLCACEIDVKGAMPRVVRIMLHAQTQRSRAEIEHVYTRGAEALRQDLQR